MSRKLLLSVDGVVRNVTAYRVAVGGVVKEIKKALVADGGVVRWYYPEIYEPYVPPPDPNIVWPTQKIDTIDIQDDPANAIAWIEFYRDTGKFTYKIENSKGNTKSGTFLSVPVTAPEQYLIKVDQFVGDPITGTMSTWIDLYDQATHRWELEQDGPGLKSGDTIITIAAADGAVPDPGTEVPRPVDFLAQVLVIGSITWNSLPWSLNSYRENVNATCLVKLYTDGDALGASTYNTYNEEWFEGIVINGADYTVQCDLITGTAPGGSALGVPLTLDANREWSLITTKVETLTCTVDVTVTDTVLAYSITKRVTMTSERFDPPAPPPRLTWTADPITVTQQATSPADATGRLILNTSTGFFTYDNFPNAQGSGQFLNPPLAPTETGLYLIRAFQLSGTITGPIGTWLDLAAVSEFEWSLTQSGLGQNLAQINVTIAADDGTGVPVTNSGIVKVIDFVSTVTGSKNVWTTDPRDLETITEAVPAVCQVQTTPTGSVSGDATTGAFTDPWHLDNPNADPTGFTVRVDSVVGDAFDAGGSAIDSDLPLSASQRWTLTAAEGEDKSVSFDMTITDTVNVVSVVKPVTMRSYYIPSDPPPVEQVKWILTDAGFPQGIGITGSAYVTFNPDGTSLGERESFQMPRTTQSSQDWSAELPPDNPGNYEVMLESVSGAGNVTAESPDLGEWVNLANVVQWEIPVATRNNTTTFTYQASYRLIGGMAQTVLIDVVVTEDDGTTP